jgi:acetyl/propionyl-CoA carboxylase alpha subunit
MPKRLQISAGADHWTAEVSGHRISLSPGEGPLTVSRAGDRLRVDGFDAPLAGDAVTAGDVVWVTVGGEVFTLSIAHGTKRVRSDTRDHDAFTPPMSATVVRIAVAPGDTVKDGDVLIALEAMKMELPIRAPRDGVVRAVHCQPGDMVQPGQVLLDLE